MVESGVISEEFAAEKQYTAEIFQCIAEFLQYNDYSETYQALQSERERKRYQTIPFRTPMTQASKEQYFNNMLRCFDQGRASEFFELWRQYVPPQLLGYDLESQKREFYLRVYFAIFPVNEVTRGKSDAPEATDIRTSMASFKQYIENRGQNLAKSGEFLAFYALPYISDPSKHPSFEQLFSLDWVTQQRMTLEKYLQTIPPEQNPPQLYQMLDSHMAKGAHELHSGRLTLSLRHGPSPQNSLPPVEEMDDTIIDAIDEEGGDPGADPGKAGGGGEGTDDDSHMVRSEQQSAASVATSVPSPTKAGEFDGMSDVENTSMLAMSTGQGSRSDVSQDAHEHLHILTHSQFRDSGRPESPIKSNRSVHTFQQAVLPALNYALLQKDIAEGDDQICCRLLSAIRQRLQKTPLGPDRHRVLATYIEWDLLRAQDTLPDGSLIQVVRKRDSAEVQIELVRLLSTIASYRAGRQYLLLPNSQTLQELCNILQVEQQGSDGAQGSAQLNQTLRAGDNTKDGVLQQQALATLQKLSLHKHVQLTLLKMGVLEWLVQWLSDYNNLSEYSVDYGLALFMNLCLRNDGRTRAESLDVFPLLESFVESDNIRVRTYVNGTLYSLLQRPVMRQQAQCRGLDDLLRAVAHNSNDTFAKQIKYILAQLNSTDTPANVTGGEPGATTGAMSVDSSQGGGGGGGSVRGTDDDECWDTDDVDDDVEEEILRTGGELSSDDVGEQLLCGQYLASTEEAQSEISMLRSSLVLRDLHNPMESFWGRNSVSTAIRRSQQRFGPLSEVPIQRPTTPTMTKHDTTHANWAGSTTSSVDEHSARRKTLKSLRGSTEALREARHSTLRTATSSR